MQQTNKKQYYFIQKKTPYITALEAEEMCIFGGLIAN